MLGTNIFQDDHVIATRTCQIFLGHICSDCGSPVLQRVSATAKAKHPIVRRERSVWPIAEAAAKKAAKEALRSTTHCRKTHSILSCRDTEEEPSEIGGTVSVSMTGYNNACPCCGHWEPWMPKRLSSRKLDTLLECNFPLVFYACDTAQAWALEAVQNSIPYPQKQHSHRQHTIHRCAGQYRVCKQGTAVAFVAEAGTDRRSSPSTQNLLQNILPLKETAILELSNYYGFLRRRYYPNDLLAEYIAFFLQFLYILTFACCGIGTLLTTTDLYNAIHAPAAAETGFATCLLRFIFAVLCDIAFVVYAIHKKNA